MSTPTILQVLPELRTGGVERGTVEITEAIHDAGWIALVASAEGPMVSKVLYAGGQHFNMPLATKKPFEMIKNIARLEKVIRDKKVDIVHARSRAPAWSAYFAAKSAGAKFVTTFHGVYGLKAPLKKTYNAIMTKGERVIAVSHFVADHIRENYKVPEDKIRVIHRGADLNTFAPNKIMPRRMAELAKQWQIPDDDRPIIVVPGRITRWKGQDVCIAALALLKHKHFLCLLIGDYQKHPEYSDELSKMIHQLGLEGTVRMVGDTPYMAEAYQLATLVVAPSVEPEAFGRVAIEAQAMGRPVIATKHGGAMETVMDNDTGWLVEPGNEEALAIAIEHALSLSKDEHERISQNAMWNAQTNFSTAVMQQKTLDVYRELLG